MRQQRPLVVDVVGGAGSGKTTLSPLIVKALQNRRPALQVHADRSGPDRFRLHPVARIKWTLRHPTILLDAARCLPVGKKQLTRRRSYLDFVGLLSRRSAVLHGYARRGHDLVLIDQGIVWRLYRTHAKLISRLTSYLRPDVIVELRCTPTEGFVRWLARNKPRSRKTQQLVREPDRTPTATLTLARIASVAAAEDWPALLKTWGEVYAEPPLSDDEVAALVAGRLADPSPEPAPEDTVPERWREQPPDIGVPWLVFDTGGGATPEQVADDIADAVVVALER